MQKFVYFEFLLYLCRVINPNYQNFYSPMKKRLFFALMCAVIFGLMFTSCLDENGTKLVNGSPYTYWIDETTQGTLTFTKSHRFTEEMRADGSLRCSIKGTWLLKQTKDKKWAIVVNYDLKSLTPYDQEAYELYEGENQYTEQFSKEGDIYGFGPGLFDASGNFAVGDGKDADIILQSQK